MANALQMKELIHSVAKSAKSLGILDETAYRNLCWKLEFEEKLNCEDHAAVEVELKIMAQKYNTSYETMRGACYPAGEKKEILNEVMKLTKTKRVKVRRVHTRRK